MPNPSGAVAGNAQNFPEAHVPRSRSRFPLRYEYPHTDPFGEYRPILAEDVNKDEIFPINSQHDIRSYTLKSPLMQNVRRNKDYFFVPSMALLPKNWNKFFDHPVRGGDVLPDVGPTVEGFWNKVSSAMSKFWTGYQAVLADTSMTDSQILLATFRFLILGEYFYSNGNLLATLNCHGSPYVTIVPGASHSRYPDNLSWDALFDDVIGVMRVVVKNFYLNVDTVAYTVADTQNNPGDPNITWHHALSLLRDDPTATITGVTLVGSGNLLVNALTAYFAKISSITFSPANVPCKLEKLWAYQLVVAHYFSNDHVDYIYSAELFRQLIGHYVSKLSASAYFSSTQHFTMNGISYEYDYLSAYNVINLLKYCSYGNLAQTILIAMTYSSDATYRYACALGFLSSLFAFRRSLRYLDYFTGSRTQPLAVVGNTSQTSTDVAVNNNVVSVIDITKSIQAQRLLNSVNRVRQTAEGYLKGIFGGKLPAPDYHNPFYLAHTSDVIYGQETENTGVNQMQDNIAITTNLRGTSGNYVFEAHSDRPGIIIGLGSYDITRIYTKSTDRSFFHVDRYDWFNPFLQYIGDQAIYLQELGINPTGTSLSIMTPFSYTLRHMEYKQKINYASGGFCENGYLPGWIFVASDRRGTQATLNPDWIRSVPAEFDRFYVSLNGYSLATYFHFIVKDYNSCNASRPMSYSPQILG